MDRHIRNVRNFWIEAEIDGKRTPLAGGPAGRRGGFVLRVYQRDRGTPRLVMELNGLPDGEYLHLFSTTHLPDGSFSTFSVVTTR